MEHKQPSLLTDCLLRVRCNVNELVECFFQEIPSNFGKGCDTVTTLRLCGPWNTSATFPLRPRTLKISDPCHCIWDLFPLTSLLAPFLSHRHSWDMIPTATYLHLEACGRLGENLSSTFSPFPVTPGHASSEVPTSNDCCTY